ncbi:SGNH/GDSL hydrolase family protein [Dietzia cinnamea]|uniref:SGNH/GDSL hydrolase family protein n=1 Tax=Dietzia cinnamea TaxID=321318 RepID=UPI003CFBC42B
MSTPHRRRRGPLTTSLALAAAAALVATPAAAAQSTAQPDGAIAVSSLGATNEIPGSVAGSLGSLAEPAYAEYVALGDSYAAFGDQSGVAAPCGRSASNYPGLLDANPAVGELTDVTCGGAVTEDLFEAQHPGVAPQLEALDEDTDLVTLSIGGNDVGFGTIVGCITRQGPFAPLPASATCESQVGGTVQNGINRVFGENGAVDGVYDAIAAAAPNATVIATQYMPLMPDEGETCAFTEQLNPADVQWAREVTDQINDAVAVAAQRSGHVAVMPVDDAVDRSACAPNNKRWTDFTGEAPGSAPMHPTALGQQAMAAAIAAAL